MIRLGLVTYLVIATFAGPLLCCCTTARLVAGFASPASRDQSQSRPAKTGCCRHSSTAHNDKAPADKHQPDCPQCPGKQDCVQPVLSNAELDGSNLVNLRPLPSDWVLPALLADIQSSLTLSAFRAAAGDLSLLPFLSTRDILFRLHMLRC